MWQPALHPEPPDALSVDLRGFDVCLVHTSAGKDSEVVLQLIADEADRVGTTDRVTALHCALGDVEWPGTAALARHQTERLGVRYVERHRAQGLLLDQVRQRRRWPSAAARYCTSDQKRGVGRKLITELVSESGVAGRPARVLNVMGLRGAESRARARKPVLALDDRASSGRREVWTWYPIHDWSTERVWATIHERGLPYHPAYDLGLSRLSCTLCILSSRAELVRACQLRPDLVDEYVALEAEIGHRFRFDVSMAELAAEAAATPADQVLADVQRVLADHARRFGPHAYLTQVRDGLVRQRPRPGSGPLPRAAARKTVR